jgi:DNA-binding Xre family transcriptional regulator
MRVQLNVRQIAEAKGYTRTKLSRAADVNYATINAIWNDETHPVMLETLLKIAYVLRVDVHELYVVLQDDA